MQFCESFSYVYSYRKEQKLTERVLYIIMFGAYSVIFVKELL